MSPHRRRSYRDFAEMSGFEIELPSSPDPLADEDPDATMAMSTSKSAASVAPPVPPSTTRRLLQSTASSRFSAIPGTSPRKRMFALDVGDEITPQTIFVTVEAGQETNPTPRAPGAPSVRRRLFAGSPTPQPSPRRALTTTTTTTTVPLRGLTDDEAEWDQTPRRRRRSSTRPGTPAAASTNKNRKKGASPTPRKARKSKGTPVPSSDMLQAETPALAAEPTPARRRGRPPKRKSTDNVPELGDPHLEQTLPRKRGRKSRKSMGSERIALLSAANENESRLQDIRLPNETLDGQLVYSREDDESDIWMANASDSPATDLPYLDRPRHSREILSGPVSSPAGDHDRSELEDQGPLPDETDDYAPMMHQDDKSDAGPSNGDRPAGSDRDLDYALDPESFTMIGLETMPSFRVNRSESAPGAPEMGEETSLFINKTLESFRQRIAESDEEEVDLLVSREHSPMPASNPVAGIKSIDGLPTRMTLLDHAQSPSRTIQNRAEGSTNLGVGEPVMDEDSFSDIPEEVLAAVEPQQGKRLSTDQATQRLPEAVSAVEQEAAVSSAGVTSTSSESHADEGPRQRQATPRQTQVIRNDTLERADNRSASRSGQSRRASGQSMQRSSPPQSTLSFRSFADTNRLLTPDDTTSSSAGAQSPGTDQQPPAEDERAIASDDLGSSPPELTTNDDKHSRTFMNSRRSSNTPSHQALECSKMDEELALERHVLAEGLQSFQIAAHRPALSPVVRIGRTLQDILSDPPSPVARSSGLGSPFKGSARNSSPLDGVVAEDALRNVNALDHVSRSRSPEVTTELSEPAPPSTAKSWATSFAPISHIKSLVTHGAHLFTSPHVNMSQTLEDPFGPLSPTADADSRRDSAFMDRIRQASREGSVHTSEIGRINTVGKEHTVASTGNALPATRDDGVLAVAKTKSLPLGVRTSQGPLGYDGSFDVSYCGNADDQLAHQPPESGLTREEQLLLENVADSIEPGFGDQQPASGPDGGHDPFGGPRETQLDFVPVEDVDSGEEDIWAIEANRTASSPQAPSAQDEPSYISRKNDLSVDWGTRSTASQGGKSSGRSPGAGAQCNLHRGLPEDMEDYSLVDLHSGDTSQSSARKSTTETQRQPKRVNLSDFFSSSPNFLEKQRRAKRAALARTAVTGPMYNPAQVVSPEPTRQAQSTLPLTRPPLGVIQMSGKVLFPMPDNSDEAAQIPHMRPSATSASHRSTESQTPERESGRGPRHGQSDAVLFESWSISPSQPPTEPAPSTDPLNIVEPSTPQQDSVETSFESPNLRPLPNHGASPSKSCLRSPLKPRTTGRVVDFTSSTLSVTAQLQEHIADQQRGHGLVVSSKPLQVPSPIPGKENRPSVLKPILGSMQQSQSHQGVPEPTQLQLRKRGTAPSRIQWSREHWLYLDELLQSYQHNALEFQLRHSNALMASPQKRVSSRLLGNEATSQGVAMLLEQWHLDIVDTFKEEVGLWDEEELVKRLFALIVGGERRRQGLVPRRQ